MRFAIIPNFSGLLLIVILVISSLFIQSCIDEITFETDESAGQVIVSGGINNSLGPYSVRLSETTTETRTTKPLAGAVIHLHDSSGVMVPMLELEEEPGTYQTAEGDIFGQKGETYWITIELADGRRFSSIPETMPAITPDDEVSAEISTVIEPTVSGGTREDTSILVYASSRIENNGTPLYIKWDLEGLYLFRERERIPALGPPPNTCYVTQFFDTQRINLFETSQEGIITIDRQLIGEKKILIDYEFYRRYWFNVISSSITERRYRYWELVNNIINQSGTIFDVPPAQVAGNIIPEDLNQPQPLGYFEAAALDTSRDFLLRFDFDFVIPNPCPIFGDVLTDACAFCLRLEGSSLERPSYMD
jgi:hypothetical protein